MVLIYLFLAHKKIKSFKHQRLDEYEIYNNYKQKLNSQVQKGPIF